MSLSTKRSAYSDMPTCLSQSAICCIATFPASCGAFNSHFDFAAERLEVDWFDQYRLSTVLQSLAFCLCVAVGGDHNDGDVRSHCFGLGQEFKTAHPGHIDVGKD